MIQNYYSLWNFGVSQASLGSMMLYFLDTQVSFIGNKHRPIQSKADLCKAMLKMIHLCWLNSNFMIHLLQHTETKFTHSSTTLENRTLKCSSHRIWVKWKNQCFFNKQNKHHKQWSIEDTYTSINPLTRHQIDQRMFTR